jgi:hypothetical protein
VSSYGQIKAEYVQNLYYNLELGLEKNKSDGSKIV